MTNEIKVVPIQMKVSAALCITAAGLLFVSIVLSLMNMLLLRSLSQTAAVRADAEKWNDFCNEMTLHEMQESFVKHLESRLKTFAESGLVVGDALKKHLEESKELESQIMRRVISTQVSLPPN